MKQSVVDKIYKNTYCNYSSNKASSAEIADLVQACTFTLDKEYLDFLRIINGFELNGLNFYGTKEQEDIYVLNVLQQNEFWSVEIPKLSLYFIIGDGDMDFYCYSSIEKKYLILNKGGLEKINEYDNFTLLLESLLNIYI